MRAEKWGRGPEGGHLPRQQSNRRTPAGLAALALLCSVCVLVVSAPSALAISFGGEQTLPAPAAVSTAPPKLTGTPAQGQLMTCSAGSWNGNPSSFTYAWRRDGVPIPGQAAGTYTVQSADRGHAISCAVTARNEGGEYAIAGLPSGAYELHFRPEGNYLPQEYRERPGAETGDPVVATSGTTTGGVNASLQPGGQISGRVTSAETGTPVPGIEACVLGKTSKAQACGTSGPSGEYVVSGLPSDSYQVDFQATDPTQNYAPQYYSGATQAAAATPVAVTAGATTAGVNIALTAGGRITGTVTGGGAPIAGAEVCADASVVACATTDSQGNYTINNLATDKYTVVFQPVAKQEGLGGLFGSESNGELKPPRQSEFLGQYFNGRSSSAEAELVEVVAAGPVKKANAALEFGASVSGIVKAKEGGAPLANTIVCLIAEEEAVRCTITAADGTYEITGLAAGSYEAEFLPLNLLLFGSDNYVPQRYKDREYAETGTPFAVMPYPVKTGGINAELITGARVSGRVTAAASGSPVSGTEACATVPKGGPFGCGVTGASGEYTIAGLPTATYSIFFVPPENSEYLFQYYANQPTEATATPIPVKIGSLYTGFDAALAIGARITGRVTGADTGAPIGAVSVCARSKTEAFGLPCARTQTPGPAATATSNAVAVPAVNPLSVGKGVSINAKSGAVTFTVLAAGPGTLSWNLVFRNSDVGFADSLGIGATHGAGAAKPRCRAGFVRHGGRCVHATVAFAKGSRSVPAGTVKVVVHPSSKALRALRSGHTLHVSGAFVYVPAAGSAATRSVAVTVRLPRHRKR